MNQENTATFLPASFIPWLLSLLSTPKSPWASCREGGTGPALLPATVATCPACARAWHTVLAGAANVRARCMMLGCPILPLMGEVAGHWEHRRAGGEAPGGARQGGLELWVTAQG